MRLNDHLARRFDSVAHQSLDMPNLLFNHLE